jgi:predicted nucleic acid-binding protein
VTSSRDFLKLALSVPLSWAPSKSSLPDWCYKEVLQGFAGPNHRDQLVERLSGLAFLQPDKQDHIAAAEIRNACRRRGVQIGTIDALLIQLSQRYDLTLQTTDKDFHAAAQHVDVRLWTTG